MVGTRPEPQSSFFLALRATGFQGLCLQTLSSKHPCLLPPCLLASRRIGGEEKSNRDNPVFKIRRNSLTTKEKTFSNRNKNASSALPHFRPRGALILQSSASGDRSRVRGISGYNSGLAANREIGVPGGAAK